MLQKDPKIYLALVFTHFVRFLVAKNTPKLSFIYPIRGRQSIKISHIADDKKYDLLELYTDQSKSQN